MASGYYALPSLSRILIFAILSPRITSDTLLFSRAENISGDRVIFMSSKIDTLTETSVSPAANVTNSVTDVKSDPSGT